MRHLRRSSLGGAVWLAFLAALTVGVGCRGSGPSDLGVSGKSLVGGVKSAAMLLDGLQDSDLVEARSETLWSAESLEWPRLSILSYDPKGQAAQHQESAVTEAPPVVGFQRYANPAVKNYAVTFTEGLDLQGALIYVDGDLISDEPLKGHGALVATGNVTLRGGATMKADTLAAVVAGGDLTVSGKHDVPSLFSGLLYSEGNLVLSNTRAVGAAIAAGTAEDSSKMSLVDSEVLSSPEGRDVTITVKSFPDLVGGASKFYESEATVDPQSSDFFVNGHFNAEPRFVASQVKVFHEGTIYDTPKELPKDVARDEFNRMDTGYTTAVAIWIERVKLLQAAHEKGGIEFVRFDLELPREPKSGGLM